MRQISIFLDDTAAIALDQLLKKQPKGMKKNQIYLNTLKKGMGVKLT